MNYRYVMYTFAVTLKLGLGNERRTKILSKLECPSLLLQPGLIPNFLIAN